MSKRWRIHSHDPDRITTLGRSAGIPAVVAQLLVSRGVTDPSAAREFLDPKLADLRDPELLPGCTEAAARIHQAARAGKRICIHGDYDVDGMTGTALLYLGLKLLGADVNYYIPHRLDEGYGLNSDTIRAKAAEKVDLIVTVDCGIASLEAGVAGQTIGHRFDHHRSSRTGRTIARRLGPCPSRLPGGGYPFGGLSGSGVAFKLAWEICQQSSGAGKSATQ